MSTIVSCAHPRVTRSRPVTASVRTAPKRETASARRAHYPVFAGIVDLYNEAQAGEFIAELTDALHEERDGRGNALSFLDWGFLADVDPHPDMRVKLAMHAICLPSDVLDRLTTREAVAMVGYMLLSQVASDAGQWETAFAYLGRAMLAEQHTQLRLAECGHYGRNAVRILALLAEKVGEKVGEDEVAEAANAAIEAIGGEQ